jgi:hypothetical protein
MTAPNWGRCWPAFMSHALQDAGAREPARIGSSLTRATAIRAVGAGCASGGSSIRFHNDATSAHRATRLG